MTGQVTSQDLPHHTLSNSSILAKHDRLSAASGLVMFAWCAGLASVSALPRLPDSWLVVWLLGATALVLAFPFRRYALAGSMLAVAAFALGLATGGERAASRLAGWLPESQAGRDITLVGRIEGLPRRADYGERFVLGIEAVETPLPAGVTLPERIALTRYAPSRRRVAETLRDGATRPTSESTPLPFSGGERWRLTVRLKPPHGSVNPGGFDFEAWLLQRGIGATGYVREQPAAERLGDAPGLSAAIDRQRESIRTRLHQVLVGAPYAGVVAALAIGDQDAIDEAGWEIFNRTGTTHLMSISGLHVTLLAALVAVVVGFVWRRVPWLVERFAARRASLLGGLVAAVAYAALAGFGIPAQRTVLMLGVVVLALLARRAVAARRVLLLALVVVLSWDPWAVLAPGFWLSFGTVALLLATGTGFLGPRYGGVRASVIHGLTEFGRSQWVAGVATLPILAVAFQRLSLIAPLANALAIPAIGFVIAPLAVAAALIPIDAVAVLAHTLLALLMQAISFLAGLPWAVIYLPEASAWALLLALCGVGALMLPRGLPLRWFGPFLFLPLLWPSLPRPVAGEAWIDFLDVGHGLAVVVRTAAHTLQFDAGPAVAGRYDAGERVVVPALRAMGVEALDALVVSHEDSDHAGGAGAVLRELPVGELIRGLPDGHPLLAAGLPTRRCQSGVSWTWDGVRFAFLHPAEAAFADLRLKGNRRSCVLRVESASGQAALITADLEGADEAALVRDAPAMLSAQVLQLPHQGSRFSSTRPFIDAVGARAVVAPVGYRNRYGHPHPSIVERVAASGARLWRTDRDGAVQVRLGSESRVIGLRDERPRYWRRSDTIAGLEAAGEAE